MLFKRSVKFTFFGMLLIAEISLQAQAADLKQYLTPQAKIGAMSQVKGQAVKQNDPELPEWLKKSERLEAMLGDDGKSRIENAKVVQKVETPIPGLNGFVVQADVFNEKNPEGKKELFVFYTDKSKRYLFVGMLIDMEKDIDLNLVTERYVRGVLTDNPAHALRPQGMHGIDVPGGKGSKSAPIQFVIDLGHESGKSSFLNLMKLHKELLEAGKNPRPLRIVLVSAGKEEAATGAMAIALGYQKVNGNGLAMLMEFAAKGKQTGWLQPGRLRADNGLKQAMGLGIFQMEDNSSQALLARLDTLPLVYEGVGERTRFIPLPVSRADWEALLRR